ncbi:Nuclear transport receptor KAP120 (importin beta superfamily) [Ceraceosorus bombacis]|uniref:Nuclear transport receptor KAP120 (Importin beta superfamily) n=1 Tax=Ceraceosorus bombacis TaxID=401625 RepID=A0A0P1BGE5_9BASI|nr:Nuclear transport receptor KAP120 (importin beta superfamily) [Ceraceosorus bombacis]
MWESSDPSIWGLFLHIAFSRGTAGSTNRLRLDSNAVAYEMWESSDPSIWGLFLHIAFSRGAAGSTNRLRLDSNAVAYGGSDEEAQILAVRQVAMIRFKNGVDRFWRSRMVNRTTVTIPQEEKQRLRSKLWDCLNEPHRSIALHAAVSINRIARHDFPTHWGSLFDELLQHLSNAHSEQATASQELGPDSERARAARLRLLRGSDVLQRVLKELGTVKMLAGRIRMTTLAKSLLGPLSSIFHQYFVETFPSEPENLSAAEMASWASGVQLADRVRTSQLLLRAVMHLTLADPGLLTVSTTSEGGSSANVAMHIFASTPTLLSCLSSTRLCYLRLYRNATSSEQAEHLPLLTNLTKHLLGFGKLYLALIGKDRSKAARWSGWDDLILWYWSQARSVDDETLSVSRDTATTSPEALVLDRPPKFIIQALMLLKQTLTEWRGNSTSESKTDVIAPPPFNDANFLKRVADTLVERLMRLTRDDLEKWQTDPEEWAIGESNESIDLDIRPAAERTLMVLANYSRPKRLVGEHLWGKFLALGNATSVGTGDLGQILIRDAVYAAVGRCRDYLPNQDQDGLPADEAHSAADASSAAAERLVSEGMLDASAGPAWIIIRRRIAWILWEWSEEIRIPHRPAVYAVLVSLLEDSPGRTDVAVRLAAAKSLGALADTLEFDADSFAPYIEPALIGLARLVGNSELDAVDSIRSCTTSLSILTERLGARILPHIDTMARLVPTLWNSNDDPQLLGKSSILTFVAKLVRTVELVPYEQNGPAENLHHVVEPLVRQSLSNPDALGLIGKDALSLWARTLRSTPAMTPPLFGLLDLLPHLLALPDFAPDACSIFEEAAMLVPVELCLHHGHTIFDALASILADTESANVLSPIKALVSLLASSSVRLSHANAPADVGATLTVAGKVAEMISVWSDSLGEIKENANGSSDLYRAPSPANSIGMGAFSDDGGDWLEDLAPGSARATHLSQIDPAINVPLASAVADALNDAQSVFGPALLQGIDPLVLDMLRADLSK